MEQLIKKQLAALESTSYTIYNAGGGPTISVSLAELTSHCHRLSAEHPKIGSDPETSDADVPYYVTDNSTVSKSFDWVPERGVDFILEDIFRWLTNHRQVLEPIFHNGI